MHSAVDSVRSDSVTSRGFRLGELISPSTVVRRRIDLAQRMERSGSATGRRLGLLVRYRLARSWGVFVHHSARVGDVRFAHPASVVIGAGVVVEDGVTIFQNVTLGAVSDGSARYPVIRRNATLYAGSTVIGGIEVGEGAIVGAHSLVLHDVAPGATVVGAPASVVRSRLDR